MFDFTLKCGKQMVSLSLVDEISSVFFNEKFNIFRLYLFKQPILPKKQLCITGKGKKQFEGVKIYSDVVIRFPKLSHKGTAGQKNLSVCD